VLFQPKFTERLLEHLMASLNFHRVGANIKSQELGAGVYLKKPYIMEKIGVAIRAELDRR
jgi:hypothetical protein